MSFNINNFKSFGLQEGGARPSLFQVELRPPFSDPATSKFIFTCRATSVPASTIAPIEVPYFGRKIKLAGDRTFADWSVTIMNDEDFKVRDMFERWSALINTHETNIKISALNSYKASDAVVTQFGKKGSGQILRQYQMIGLFPVEISAMDLDWDATNTIQTFNVTFAYDYYIPYQGNQSVNPLGPTAGNGAGVGAGIAPAPDRQAQ